MVLKRILESKGEEVTGDWRKLHNWELHALYCSPNIISVIKLRKMRWVGQIACIADMTNGYKVLVRKPEGKRPTGSSRRR
jgi:hypothetical protein